jgi:putative endonuclease
MARQFAVYILTCASRVLYVGITNDLVRRVAQHRAKAIPGFTARYGIDRLVHYELTTNVRAAIAREKELKGWRREKKLRLIESMNPGWRDLGQDWFEKRRDSSPAARNDRVACGSE